MENTGNSLAIDIVIPTAYKDIKVLPLCIRGIKECIQNEIKDIYVISDDNEEIKDICKENSCIFINETELMGFSPSELTKIREDKRGWLYQQLIKLHGGVGTCENYLVIDSDVVLLRPYRFLDEEGIPTFITIPSTYKQYGDVNFELTGIKKEVKQAYIADKMIFNKEIIKEIHDGIEKKNNMPWIDAIVNKYDNKALFGFSEFELYALIYGNRPHKEIKLIELPMHFRDGITYDLCKKRFGSYHCVTFHHYL